MRKSELIVFGMIALSFAIGVYLYPSMPEKMASHWNAKGDVDGHMSTFWGLFLMPLISLCMLLLFIAIPKIDPLRENIEKFRKYFDGFIIMIIAFLFYIHALSLLWNLGMQFSMTRMLAPAFAVLAYYMGVLVENAKRNWFIGIRTPWTLSSEKVWNKTHRLGGKLFKAAGMIAILGFFFENQAILFIMVPLIVVSFYLVVYSYTEYRKEKK